MDGTFLEIVTEDGSRRLSVGQDPLTVGRHPSNKIVLADDQSSRFHCVIERTPNGIWVRDLDSRNGTKVNGKLIKKSLLISGDLVTIGLVEIKLNAPAPRPALVSAPEYEPEPLEEFDVLEELPPDPKADGEADALDDQTYDEQLRAMADSLPDKSLKETDITLINARGGIAHSQKDEARKQAGEVVQSFRLLLLICCRLKATDIHVEPKNEGYHVRIRVDGTMVDAVRLSKEIGIRLCALVKVLSDIDIAQRNIVQEGHFTSRVPGRQINYRISFTPSMFGQKLVIRVLDTATTPMHVWDLGMPEWMARQIEAGIKAEAGMLLVCGPTGSGKTTSLYACVRSIDTGQRNVVTIEDPVEIQIEGITQIPVNEAQGNTFPVLLRSLLRQDPDAIMVGEVRDPETARIAMQSAITGHLVFSTIHSRDTIGTIFRLLDLGIEPYLVAQGLHIVLAQRLVRVLCPFCKKPVRPTPEQVKKIGPLGRQTREVCVPTGCARCLNTGYAGRRAVYELLVMNPLLREVIQKAPTPNDIRIAMSDAKFVTLIQSANELIAQGVTSFEEAERAVGA